MTTTDLRVKFKSETGCLPTFDNYTGKLTYKYARWLEGNTANRKREQFRRETGRYATYSVQNDELYDDYEDFYYTDEYKEWLEEGYCEKYTILEELYESDK